MGSNNLKIHILDTEIITLNRNGKTRIIVTLNDPKKIAYFETNSGRFQYTHKEILHTNIVRFYYEGANAIDMLCVLRDNYMININPAIERAIVRHAHSFKHEFKYNVSELGIPPNKSRASDSGLDLVLIEEKYRKGNLTMYGTGVSVEPPSGYYFDLVPRSSIIKHGYILANSIGIIDQGYTGEIMVPLLKVDPDAPDLQLPAKVVQLIPRKWYNFVGVCEDQLTRTHRADGGFGSTSS